MRNVIAARGGLQGVLHPKEVALFAALVATKVSTEPASGRIWSTSSTQGPYEVWPGTLINRGANWNSQGGLGVVLRGSHNGTRVQYLAVR